ncbi:hypothetical protein EG349_04325 [Chryseobacterium shandongense]|jgi:hypothetical protein|uniref:DUF6876 domain-containing protein n=1 Tax=Chryseobacterium shandongense TaxID=1493872 RepID=A0A3G6MQ14_9FLAO|nr:MULTISPECIES: DUF6876 family protein [Chryseobacterium]AZA57822.1 hypothetical protein EG350_11795 [Chryseobacterium shandongense]AZA86062.1 hypothetical protein EG349_04325 [Chryseobacterium shandongense]AZA94470.1 hypothetical protein EG353_02345 [Chryseobacterium shandongense]
MKNYMQSANDYYRHFIQPRDFIEFQSGFFLSEGIFRISGETQCNWLLQIICFQQKESGAQLVEFWKLKRIEGLDYLLQCKDSSGSILFEKTFISPDFSFDEITIWKVGTYLILPGEYNEFVKLIRNEAKSFTSNILDDHKIELN